MAPPRSGLFADSFLLLLEGSMKKITLKWQGYPDNCPQGKLWLRRYKETFHYVIAEEEKIYIITEEEKIYIPQQVTGVTGMC